MDAARAHLRTVDVEIEPRKLWPAGLAGRKGRINGCGVGRALAFADDPAWEASVVDLIGRDGPVPAEIADAMVAVLTRWSRTWQRPVAVVPMPSRRHDRLIGSLAERIATVGKLPLLDAIEVTGPPAPTDVASAARAAALTTSIRLRAGVAVPSGPVLLVDDTYRTGWTATIAGALLVEGGAASVLPLVIHQLP